MAKLEKQLNDEMARLEKTEDTKARAIIVENIGTICEKITEAENADERYFNNKDKIKIETEKIKNDLEMEKLKSRSDIRKAVVELVKIVVPAGLSLVTLEVWRSRFDKMLYFEKTGRLTTNASREVKLPKIFK